MSPLPTDPAALAPLLDAADERTYNKLNAQLIAQEGPKRANELWEAAYEINDRPFRYQNLRGIVSTSLVEARKRAAQVNTYITETPAAFGEAAQHIAKLTADAETALLAAYALIEEARVPRP